MGNWFFRLRKVLVIIWFGIWRSRGSGWRGFGRLGEFEEDLLLEFRKEFGVLGWGVCVFGGYMVRLSVCFYRKGLN